MISELCLYLLVFVLLGAPIIVKWRDILSEGGFFEGKRGIRNNIFIWITALSLCAIRLGYIHMPPTATAAVQCALTIASVYFIFKLVRTRCIFLKFLMPAGILSNAAVMAANGGRMPSDSVLAKHLGFGLVSANDLAHVDSTAGTHLPWLMDRWHVAIPFLHDDAFFSIGDFMIFGAIGLTSLQIIAQELARRKRYA